MRRVLTPLILLALLGIGCGSEETAPTPPAAAGPPPPGVEATPNRFDTGVPTPERTVAPPPAPDTAAALAAASVPVVVRLHNTMASPTAGLPAGARRDQARDVAAELRTLRTRLGDARRGPAATLSKVLVGYERVALQLARTGSPSRSSAARLKELSRRWRGALRRIDRGERTNVGATVPDLPQPRARSAPAPKRKGR